MATKRNKKKSSSKKLNQKQRKEEAQKNEGKSGKAATIEKPKIPKEDSDNESSSSSSSSEDDDLVLEGEIEEESEEISSEEEEEEPKRKKPKQQRSKTSPSTKKKNKEEQTDIVNVEFTFCDMDEKFFGGIKTHFLSNALHAPHSSELTDMIIDNIAVGTVISTEGYDEDYTYGFASVLNIQSHLSKNCIVNLKELCLKHCPAEYKPEMETVLGGKTRRPAGFFFQERMVNLPLEIVEVLHQQLVLDMEWAVKNADGDEEYRKTLDFGAFVRVAPCTQTSGSGNVYKYFDDEVFASNAEFVYTFALPRSEEEEKQFCAVIVLTSTGHQRSMKDLATLIHGSAVNDN